MWNHKRLAIPPNPESYEGDFPSIGWALLSGPSVVDEEQCGLPQFLAREMCV
jgi:hypothetical protein